MSFAPANNATPRPAAIPARRLRVVFQNRPNVFSAPGGDTVLMEELCGALQALGVDARIAAGPVDLTGVDLVHLVNLTLPEVAAEVAGNALRQRVPYAVTALLEDWPRYLERSIATVTLFKEYLVRGRDECLFQRGLEQLRALPGGHAVGSPEVATHAALLFACGASEAERLAVAYPAAAKRIAIAPLGFRHHHLSREHCRRLVREQFGFDRFLLCCGRFETRKNQLMLLKALEDHDLPLVFAAGGFSYQAPYVELIQAYTRRAPVHILGRLETGQLEALMGAAEAHVLPSWFELPGLVTLEAASAGTAVVASDWGAIRDYLPADVIHICQPDDPGSIRAAVERAVAVGPNPGAKRAADAFTWQRMAEETLKGYERFLSASPRTKQIIHTLAEVPMNSADRRSHRFDASIIMPVFNRARLTQECLESLTKMTDRASYELIIVDNHSTDETPRVLEALEGDVTVLRQPENRGFAAACNLGARIATGEVLVFLNNDTRVISGWLDTLVAAARMEKTGAAGAKLLYPDGTVQHAGVAVSERGIPYHILQSFAANHPAVCESREMQAVTAACMAVPSTVFASVGGFDEQYRNGFEDVDLCFRLRAQGYHVRYCAEATVIHHEEASPGRKDHDKENLERFLNTWSGRIVPDEAQILARHGYTITWDGGRGTYREVNAAPPVSATVASLDRARELYDAGDIEAATTMLQALVSQRLTIGHDDGFETWQTLGNCLARLNRVDEAERAYYEAIKLDKDSERPYLGLGALAILQENWQAAMLGFMNALARNPETLKGEFGVGLSMAQRHMHAEALEHFRRVLDREPFNAEALFYYYRSAVESGQPRLAVEPLQKYLERYPDDPNFLFSLCGAYWKAGDLAAAMDLCQRVLEIDPNHQAAMDVMRHIGAKQLQHA